MHNVKNVRFYIEMTRKRNVVGLSNTTSRKNTGDYRKLCNTVFIFVNILEDREVNVCESLVTYGINIIKSVTKVNFTIKE